ADLLGGRIHHQVTGGEDRGPFGGPTAHQRTQTRLENHERERFDQVVVGAEDERVGLVVLAVLGGEHEHGRPDLTAAHLAHHLVAVAGRHHDVQHHDVVLLAGGHLQPGLAVTGGVHGPAARDEAAPQALPQCRLVVHDQDPHHTQAPGWFFGSIS